MLLHLPRTFRKAVFTGALKEPEQAWRFLEIPNSTQLKGEKKGRYPPGN